MKKVVLLEKLLITLFVVWSIFSLSCGISSNSSTLPQKGDNTTQSIIIQTNTPLVEGTATSISSVSPSSSKTNLWKVEITSIQPNHVDFIIYNVSETSRSPLYFNSSLEGEVNNQVFTYPDTKVQVVQNEIPINPNYPDYSRWGGGGLNYILPGFFQGKYRVTWTIPSTVKPLVLKLTFKDYDDPDFELLEDIDLTRMLGSDDENPTLPHDPSFLKIGEIWNAGGVWEIMPLGIRRLNIFGPASGIDFMIKNIGGYTASFKNDIDLIFFTQKGETIHVDWTYWAMFVNLDDIQEEIIFGSEFSPFPGYVESCPQIEPGMKCEGVVTFDSANTRINPLTGELSFFRDDVDPNAPLINYENALLLVRYLPTNEYAIYTISD